MGETAEALGSVQKTLLLPLWGRAVETRKSAPLLVDRTAASIVERLDYDFSRIAENTHPITRLAWIARSLHVDRTLRDFLALRPRATVVNLGCGLDTTFERVDNGQLRWIDLDLPDVIELRRRLIPTGPRQRAIAGSALDPAWIAEVRSDEGLVLVAAGVLYYFEEPEARELLSRLAASCPAAEMVFDLCSRRGARIANRKVIEDTGMDKSAVLRWGIDDPRQLGAWDRRIEVLESHQMFRGITGRLPWRARPGTLISDAMNIMSMVHLRFRP
ncbi:MAG TPA: class I SAM-dependent methyltransferase [Vicinamibacteria bacterium]|nr:class I SAM-dependent methyltransferase [Vicinamibacteria bacterium]